MEFGFNALLSINEPARLTYTLSPVRAEFLISLGLLLLLTVAKTSGRFYGTIYEKSGFKNGTVM